MYFFSSCRSTALVCSDNRLKANKSIVINSDNLVWLLVLPSGSDKSAGPVLANILIFGILTNPIIKFRSIMLIHAIYSVLRAHNCYRAKMLL